jgi:hypothetical protein
MFDEPDEAHEEHPTDPKDLAKEKAQEFRMHAQLAATFEGHRKFGAQLIPGLDPEVARQVQRSIGRLTKSKPADTPILPQDSAKEAADILNLPKTANLTTNDYHIYRRPAEVILIRWLEAAEVEKFYDRLQAHFDVSLEGYISDERAANDWKQDARTQTFLAALEKSKIKMADVYLRDVLRKLPVFVLSTQTADEMDIIYLCDTLMGVSVPSLVGAASAPPEEPSERDRAWFFNLLSLRGSIDGIEKMCFFTYLQKAEDTFDSGD